MIYVLYIIYIIYIILLRPHGYYIIVILKKTRNKNKLIDAGLFSRDKWQSLIGGIIICSCSNAFKTNKAQSILFSD